MQEAEALSQQTAEGRMSTGRLINKAKGLLITHPRTIALCIPSRPFPSPRSPTVRCSSDSPSPIVTMNRDIDSQLDAIFQQKRSLRSKIRRELKNMDLVQRSKEDNEIQSIVLEAPWFKSSKSLCAYFGCATLQEVDTSRILSESLCNPAKGGYTEVRKKLYVPRVEDRNSNMRMLKISSINDLVASSMNILEPAPVDCDGEHEDAMQASNPVDLFIIPGLAFDRSGRRLGRSGGYYDVFFKKYQELAKERKWKQPLLVALSYSLQLVREGAIAVTPNDVPMDALVSPAGFIPISPAALERCN